MNEKFMRAALKEAQKAYDHDEVPVGAVIVCDDMIVARGYNKREMKQLATAHAEIIAIEKANKKIGYWRLEKCDLYVTMEPCLMCAGAIINSRIKNVYYGAKDNRVGVIEKIKIFDEPSFNHHPNYYGGILEEECSSILSSYFSKKRKEKKK